jgi:hypothetical protein
MSQRGPPDTLQLNAGPRGRVGGLPKSSIGVEIKFPYSVVPILAMFGPPFMLIGLDTPYRLGSFSGALMTGAAITLIYIRIARGGAAITGLNDKERSGPLFPPGLG